MMRARPPARAESKKARFARLARHEGAVTSREGLPSCDAGSSKVVKSMVVGDAYEFGIGHPHTRLVLKAVRAVHEV